MIDLRSFSNLWYWIVLAILWSALSQRVMGVPYWIVVRARRGDVAAHDDMLTLVEVTARRTVAIADTAGPALMAITAFVLTGLGVTGWLYWVEFCQAIFLLMLPLTLVGAVSIWTARKLVASDYADLDRRLRVYRIIVQGMGVIFIFLTAFWGMYVNVRVGPLG